MADIFISYASEDTQRVERLVTRLTEERFSVWWDRKLRAGRSFDAEIEKQLDNAACVIVIWSRHSITSEWVRSEAYEGFEREILVPILIDEVRPPLPFRRLHATLNLDHDADPLPEDLLRSLRALIGRSPDTSQTRNQATGSRATRVLTAASRPAQTIGFEGPSLVVLPLTNLSTNSTSETNLDVVADGLTEDLIHEASRFADLTVIARNSSFVFKGSNMDVRQIGEVLQVRYVLQGSVRIAGDRVRLTLNLADTHSSAQLWAERFDGTLGALLELSEDSTRAIGTALGIQVRQAEAQRARRTPMPELGVWERFVRAKHAVTSLTRTGMAETMELLEEAHAMAPDDARVMAGLAFFTAMHFVFLASEDPMQDLQRSMDLAAKAPLLSPADDTVLYLCGGVHLFSGQRQEGLTLLQRALDLSPNNAELFPLYGQALVQSGDFEAGIRFIRDGMARDPFGLPGVGHAMSWMILGFANSYVGDLEGALVAFDHSRQQFAGNPWAWIGGALTEIQLQRPDTATQSIRQARILLPQMSSEEMAGVTQIFRPADHSDAVSLNMEKLSELWEASTPDVGSSHSTGGPGPSTSDGERRAT